MRVREERRERRRGREREREGYETFFHKHSAGFELTELEAKRIVKLEARPS